MSNARDQAIKLCARTFQNAKKAYPRAGDELFVHSKALGAYFETPTEGNWNATLETLHTVQLRSREEMANHSHAVDLLRAIDEHGPTEPPIEPPAGGQSWKIKPGGYFEPDGTFHSVTANLNPIEVVFGNNKDSTAARRKKRLCDDGDTLLVDDGQYPFMKTSYDNGDPDAPPITIMAKNVGKAVILANPVGGSSTWYREWDQNTILHGFKLIADDKASLMTPLASSGYTGQNLQNLLMEIAGSWDPTDDSGFNEKWAMLTNGAGLNRSGDPNDLDDPGWLVSGGSAHSVKGEHAYYGHGSRGSHVFRRWKAWDFGRTGIQDTNRPKELYPGMAMGIGYWLVDDCDFEDMCMQPQGGGSVLSFHGNRKGDTRIQLTKVRLGSTKTLDPQVAKNITGAFVCYDGGYGPNQGVVSILGCDFEVGKLHQGVGDARRPNIDFNAGADVFETLPFMGKDSDGEDVVVPCRAVNHPGASSVLSVMLRGSQRWVTSRQNQFLGTCIFNGNNYPNYDAMLAAAENNPNVEVRS